MAHEADAANALVDKVAAELRDLRRRPLDEMDDPKDPKVIPHIERLAETYCLSQGLHMVARRARVVTLVTDGLAAFAQRGVEQEAESRFIHGLFLDTSGQVPAKRPRDLLEEAKRAAEQRLGEGYNPDRFNKYMSATFQHFAAFLISFVAASSRPPRFTTATGEASDVSPTTTGDVEPIEAVPVDVVTELQLAAPPPDDAAAPGGTVPPGGADQESAAAAPAASSEARTFSITWPRSLQLRVASLVLCVLVFAVLLMSTHVFGLIPAGGKTGPGLYTSGKTYREVSGQFGTNTFSNPHSPGQFGPHIEPYTTVQVSCKLLAPTIPSISPDGYWYRIAAPLETDKYYAPATNFLNGDPVVGARKHYTDLAVPDCPS